MTVDLYPSLRGENLVQWQTFMDRMGLHTEGPAETTVLLREDGCIAASGSRQGNVLKYLAVDPAYQGEGLTASLLTALRRDAFAQGIRHLFLYTKPRNQALFAPLFFYPVAKTDQVLLMEDRKNGVRDFVQSLEAPCTHGTVGAAVMHCDPFTKGHRWLIETAAARCDWLYIFVLSEDRGRFPAGDRLELVRRGTADLKNVTVHPTGPYLISSATFPSYFLKDRATAGDVQCRLDIEIFARQFAPRFGITRRFVGTEPLCPVTAQYNENLARLLPGMGVELCRLDRLEQNGAPISASAVRALLGRGDPDALKALVPETTFAYLKERELI